MSKVALYGSDILLSVVVVYLFFCYFDIFFEQKRDRRLFAVGLAVFALWQFVIPTPISLPAYINITVTTIVTLIAATVAYEGIWWNKCVFAIAFNAIWMLMETLCNYILVIYCEKYAMVQPVGSFISNLNSRWNYI